MNLTEHFTLEELTFSPTAERQKINNTPPLEVVAHLTTLATRVPFVHFFDGFRTSHEMNRVMLLGDDDLHFPTRFGAKRTQRGQRLDGVARSIRSE